MEAPVPTLTEVVAPGWAPAAEPDADDIAGAVLAELQPRIELLLEARLREALGPALARAVDGLIRDSREQLAATLQALVQDSVARVLDQRRRRTL